MCRAPGPAILCIICGAVTKCKSHTICHAAWGMRGMIPHADGADRVSRLQRHLRQWTVARGDLVLVPRSHPKARLSLISTASLLRVQRRSTLRRPAPTRLMAFGVITNNVLTREERGVIVRERHACAGEDLSQPQAYHHSSTQ